LPSFPSHFDYKDQAERSPITGETIYRPYIPISMSWDGSPSQIHLGLADTGAASVISSWALANEMGLDPTTECHNEVPIMVGGRSHPAIPW